MPEKYQDVMRKAVYDTNDDGVVDAAATAAAVSGVSPLSYAGDPNTNVTSVFIGQICVNPGTDTTYVATVAGVDNKWQVTT